MTFIESPSLEKVPDQKPHTSPEHFSAEAVAVFNEREAVTWNLHNRESGTHAMYEKLLAENEETMIKLGLTEQDYESWKKQKFVH